MDLIDLFPTPTRLRLLRLVEAGVVSWDPANERAYCVPSGETLTAAIQEVGLAGWVTIPGERAPVTLATLGADQLAEADRC